MTINDQIRDEKLQYVQGIRAKFLRNLKQIGIKLNLVWLEA